MAGTQRTEAVSLSDLTDGDTIVLDDGTNLRVGDYITWEPDGAHLEGITNDGAVGTFILPKDKDVQRIIDRE
ncbi:hypothetical protein SAMN05445060_0381 [Williamsia sterculiae]|uniref:Uncharacterized protein n=2 Tax=Williamsia sterculiae TaxID=1344003 RepID=A0A1N7CUY5_9NOCA|nr:hypothetical protein SAMN05445060_0381 [Williamsia sterculiae]